MFISIPKEFFVPVIFGEGFTLNEENNNLEIDLNMYRESTGKKDNSNLKMNKEYLENSKTAKEKQDIVNIEVNMNEKQCGNKAKVEDNTTTNKKENGSTIYVPLKEKSDFEKLCSNEGKIFEELDDEFIENININLKGCNKNCN
ncbi:hypothetical protein [uncultured Clostridium sp.]|uniref:hypothetical protein n=1 Tax=Clostridium sp. TaxID=1506 RepID=UPI0025E9FF96|nr:hypothetical protein [uncultured Clostridium sp.]